MLCYPDDECRAAQKMSSHFCRTCESSTRWLCVVSSAARDAYGGYCDAVDRAVAVAGESFVAGEDAG